MDFNPLIAWLQHQIKKGVFGVHLFNSKDISDPIVKAISDKEYETVDPNSISEPIVEALREATKAIKDKEGVTEVKVLNQEKTDFTEVLGVLRELLKKETVFKQGDVKIDLKSVVKGLDNIERILPQLKPQEVIDYTLMFDQMCSLMEKPGYSIELLRITEILEKISTSKFPDFKFNKDGELIVEQGKQRIFFDHKNQNKAGEYINPLTEETGAAILAAVDGLEVSVGDVDVNTDGLETLVTSTNTKLDTLNGQAATAEKQDEQTAAINNIVVGGGFQATKITDAYSIHAVSNDGTYDYIFKEDGAGNWFIQRIDANDVFLYAKGTGGVNSVYVDKTSAPIGSPTWGTYDETFTNIGAGSLNFDADGNLKIGLYNSEGEELADNINHAIVTMDWEHHAVHEGILFHLNVYSTVVAGTPKYCEFITGAKYIHLKQKTIMDGADTLLCQFIEAPTVTNGTTLVTPVNRNRNSANTSTMTIYSDPGTPTGGTVLDMDYLYADDSGNNGNGNAATPQTMSMEWVLKPNTKYIYKLENLGDGTANFLAKLNWYEKP